MSPVRCGVVWLFVVIGAYSLAPYELVGEEPGFSRRVDRCLEFSTEAAGSIAELVLHALVFVPIGATLAIARRQAARWWGLAVVVVLCAVIEACQLYLPKRHAHAADLVANLVGAGVGSGMIWAMRGRVERWRSWYATRETQLHRAAFAVAAVLLMGLMVIPSAGLLSLDGWDRSFRLLVGNEGTGDRPWVGEMRWLAIYDRALGTDDVASCEATVGSPHRMDARRGMGCLAAYDFARRTGGVVESIGSADAPRLIVANACGLGSAFDGEGLWIGASTIVATETPPRDVVDAIVEADAFSLELWCRPGNLTQDGPARIVSLSADPRVRNFTVGQSGSAFEFRVRNGMSRRNGAVPRFRTGDGVLDDGLTHLVATYDRGGARVFVDGVAWERSLDYRSLPVPMRLGASTSSAGSAGVFGLVSALMCAIPLTVSGLVVFGPGGVTRRWLRTAGVVTILITAGLAAQYALSGYAPNMATAGWMFLALGLFGPVACGWCFDAEIDRRPNRESIAVGRSG